MKTRLVGYLYLAAAMAGVGSTVVASRVAAGGLPPFTATALRFLIATPLLLALMRMRRLRWTRPSTRDAVLLVIQAAAGGVGYTVLLICGTKLASPIDAGVMLGTLPAMSTLIAAVVLRERQTRRDWVAAALATSGVLFVTFAPGHAMPSMRALVGDALVLAAVACEAVFILLNRRLTVPLPPLTLSTAMSALGFVLALIPAAFEWRAVVSGWTFGAVSAIAYYALVPTVLGYLCMLVCGLGAHERHRGRAVHGDRAGVGRAVRGRAVRRRIDRDARRRHRARRGGRAGRGDAAARFVDESGRAVPCRPCAASAHRCGMTRRRSARNMRRRGARASRDAPMRRSAFATTVGMFPRAAKSLRRLARGAIFAWPGL
ncbi:hypothetical protein FEP07_05694 [Burkholderia multivorans]|nr:hypothetical protein [Burkholderia multivorans]MDR9270789.1 hypothetical protein [Burkholderia multivorans]MDR9288351.1 hypothetical protein [Burkholderia multivorans]MDR9294008.1 hypothetical protein [Burkholderia multivorans]MDR9327785.1 hypothetical protein [Burkholderia multivorans]